MAQRSRRAAAGVKGHHHGGGKVTRIFFRLINPSVVHRVVAGPLEWVELGRVAAHSPAQTPLHLAGVFGGMHSAWHCRLLLSPGCSSVAA